MASFIALGPWAWLIVGLVLIGLETLSPGIFLVWFGIAAILTGLADWAFDLPWQGNLLGFAALSGLAVAAGRRLTRQTGDDIPGDPKLNRRVESLVGRTFLLDRPITAGEGRIRVDDTVWRVVGPEMAAGSSVRVVRADGTTLVVEGAS
ncbi:NfeD family protein [uncultured Enterovirga sp.]|uniref:NfeD family protein n=1 Tax=uncultured Enterovirga sp. TaxID=2026352 RepID=UPI0035CC584F